MKRNRKNQKEIDNNLLEGANQIHNLVSNKRLSLTPAAYNFLSTNLAEEATSPDYSTQNFQQNLDNTLDSLPVINEVEEENEIEEVVDAVPDINKPGRLKLIKKNMAKGGKGIIKGLTSETTQN